MDALSALLRAMRPRQWLKNVLVAPAPIAAGVIDESGVFGDLVVAFVAMCLAASAVYLVNDVCDAEADRRHPTKRLRPIASGSVSPTVALCTAAVLVAGAIAISLLADPLLILVVSVYVAMSLAYSLGLKHVALLEMALVTSGFVLRALAGAAATDVPISEWFFVVMIFGPLLIVAAKRESELRNVDDAIEQTRPVLLEYSIPYLAGLRWMATAVVLLAYGLWAFDRAEALEIDLPLLQLSFAPVAIGALRYGLLVDQGHGEAPERLVTSDLTLFACGVAAAACFVVGIYVA